jgi:hypothetical protein
MQDNKKPTPYHDINIVLHYFFKSYKRNFGGPFHWHVFIWLISDG